MSFDEIIDRRGSNCTKWDRMAAFTGVNASDAIAMWVADMDFKAPEFLQDAVRGLLDKANYGYFIGEDKMNEAVAWWMAERHGWEVDPAAMTSTYGLGNGIALSLHTYTNPGDEVIIFTPVYHEFTLKINRTKRVVKESPLVIRDGVYHMDLEALEASLSGREKVVMISSPHNPAGRVWSVEELRALGAFCERHDLLLISDEIHHDMVFPGSTHVPFAVAVPESLPRLIMMTSASKTFNIAGSRLGTVSIPDPDLRATFKDFFGTMEIQPNLLGVELTRASYSPAGADWVDELVAYLDENRQLFDKGVNSIPGLAAMPMQSTYLAWVDFAGTGMAREEFTDRVLKDARIAPNQGYTFGTGGEDYLRFNLAAPRARIAEAVDRLADAFSDLQ